MKGETKVLKLEPGKSELELLDTSSTLPATSTFDVKVEKSENFDAYIASKDDLQIFVTVNPMIQAGWFEKCGDEHLLQEIPVDVQEYHVISPEEFIKDFDEYAEMLSFYFTGSFQNSGNNITFKGTVK